WMSISPSSPRRTKESSHEENENDFGLDVETGRKVRFAGGGNAQRSAAPGRDDSRGIGRHRHAARGRANAIRVVAAVLPARGSGPRGLGDSSGTTPEGQTAVSRQPHQIVGETAGSGTSPVRPPTGI